MFTILHACMHGVRVASGGCKKWIIVTHIPLPDQEIG